MKHRIATIAASEEMYHFQNLVTSDLFQRSNSTHWISRHMASKRYSRLFSDVDVCASSGQSATFIHTTEGADWDAGRAECKRASPAPHTGPSPAEELRTDNRTRQVRAWTLSCRFVSASVGCEGLPLTFISFCLFCHQLHWRFAASRLLPELWTRSHTIIIFTDFTLVF